MGAARTSATRISALVVAILASALAHSPGTVAQQKLTSEVWLVNQAEDRIHIIIEDFPAGDIDLAGQGDGPHLVNFSPNGQFAFVASENNGAVTAIRTSDRAIVSNLIIPPNQGVAPPFTHQAAPTPDGSRLLVAHLGNRTLYEVDVDRQSGALTLGDKSLTLPRSPVCTVFTEDGSKAYVSMFDGGIAVVDADTLTQVGEIATPGPVECGMEHLPDGTFIVTTNGGSGSSQGVVLRLDPSNDSLTEIMRIDATDIHAVTIDPNGDFAFITARGSERLFTVEVGPQRQTATAQTPTSSVSLDVTQGVNDTPDQLDFLAGKVYVSLRQVGKLAIVDGPDVTVANLGGDLLHGVAVLDRGRPRSIIERPLSSITLNNQRFRRIRGTSTDGASFIKFVELALKRRGRNGCRWWNGSTLVSRGCRDTLWFRAEGKTIWSYEFNRRLPNGRYVVRVRATDEAGNSERLQEVGRTKMFFRLR